uniref:Uncharacterized protein n=1 Tax=Heterorhabditis bacteriophora TaxID=37862 RepID=A0A1I7WUQ1_HETBA
MNRLFYNEQFDISGVSSMAEALRSAYFHGLPYPILSVLEYFSLNQDAFDWGRHYRTAGHYTHAAGMLSTGLSALFGCLLYLLMSPCKLRIGFVGTDGERMHMDMSFRWAFYLVFIVGQHSLLALFFGLLLILLQHYRFYTLSTFLDATLDETVGPKRRGGQEDSPLKSFPNNLEVCILFFVMRQCKPSRTGSTISEKKSGGSSGFQSRSSYSESLRSHSSFESMHDVSELERSPSNLTIREERCPNTRKMILHVEHF